MLEVKYVVSFFPVRLLQITGEQGFVISEAPRCSGGDGVVHTKVHKVRTERSLLYFAHSLMKMMND